MDPSKLEPSDHGEHHTKSAHITFNTAHELWIEFYQRGQLLKITKPKHIPQKRGQDLMKRQAELSTGRWPKCRLKVDG